VARFSCDSVAICYLLLVLWMTSYFQVMTLVRFVYSYVENTASVTTQIPTTSCSVIKTGSTHCEFHARAKSAVYDCLVNSRSLNGCRADKQGSGYCYSCHFYTQNARLRPLLIYKAVRKNSGGSCSFTLRLLPLHTPSPFNPEHV